MKNIVIAICSLVLIVILTLTVYTLHGRSVRKEELNRALSSSLEQAMERTGTEQAERIESDEDLLALFLETLLMQIDSRSQVTVNVLDVDCLKGLLSVEVVMTYPHPIGRIGTISLRQTAIRETVEPEEKQERCRIDYLVEGQRYKTYELIKGSKVILPREPEVAGKRFLGWQVPGETELFTLADWEVEKNYTFVAVFH